jgi:hypothetical protein
VVDKQLEESSGDGSSAEVHSQRREVTMSVECKVQTADCRLAAERRGWVIWVYFSQRGRCDQTRSDQIRPEPDQRPETGDQRPETRRKRGNSVGGFIFCKGFGCLYGSVH